MYGFQNLFVMVLEIYIVCILSKVSTFIRLVIDIRSQLYSIAIATMHFCFGFHFYDVDPDGLTKIFSKLFMGFQEQYFTV